MTVANAWLRMHDPTVIAMQSFHGTSVCTVQLGATLPLLCVQHAASRQSSPCPGR